ncbi:hypothetical protein BDD12DRAFT_882677 [Trichophaea hybrida]|nr:hypothetical protein BDD12DRAFT_882677 [Trichophaea hybrida]
MSTTICSLCDSNPSKYKCPTCSTPYCSVACYKPHKLAHTLEPPPPPPPPPPVETPAPAKPPHKFACLLENPEIAAMLQSCSLQHHLTNIYAASMRPSDEEMERRQRNSQRQWERRKGKGREGRGRGGRGRGGRGGGGGGSGSGGGTAPTVTWSQEKADETALARLKRLRMGGREENVEVEEFVRRVVDLLDKEKDKGKDTDMN